MFILRLCGNQFPRVVSGCKKAHLQPGLRFGREPRPILVENGAVRAELNSRAAFSADGVSANDLLYLYHKWVIYG